jgi:hypothetical protein
MQGGVILHQIVPRDRNRGRGASYLHLDAGRHGDRGSYRYIGSELRKARRVRNQVIGVEGQVGEFILARCIRFGAPFEPTDRIFNGNGSVRYHRTRTICDRSGNGAGGSLGVQMHRRR